MKLVIHDKSLFTAVAALTVAMLLLTPLVFSAQNTSMINWQWRNVSPLHVDGKNIETNNGDVIYLRGVQKVNFADDSDGAWLGDTFWNDSNVKTELSAMKAWGANTVRCIQAVENWKYNLDQPYATLSNREAVKRLLTFAGQNGMYVIFTGYRVTNFWHGGEQDPLPYPPYQTSQNASSVIGSKQDFVDWWANVAEELKGYPNVIFEVWNEASGTDAQMVEYFGVVQQVIDAIRATGAQQLILVQWNSNCWVNLDSPPPNGEASTMDWISQANLTDSQNNLVYVTHIYRDYGCTGMYSDAGSIQQHGSSRAWEYSEIKRALQYEKIDWVENVLNKPLFITETGANMDQTGSEYTREMAAWNSTLTIFDEWGLNYVAHWWRDIGTFRLLTSDQTLSPTESGTILQNKLKG
jgi:hypothetical protein